MAQTGAGGDFCPACFYLLRHLARQHPHWAAALDAYLDPPAGQDRPTLFAQVMADVDPQVLATCRAQVQALLRARAGEEV
jgi:hypothetical protein